MDLMITVNVWFIAALCLLFLIIGLLMGGGGGGGGRGRGRYYRY